VTFESEWERCAPWIAAALQAAPSGHSLEDVKALVERREVRFWAGRKAAMVTEIQTWPQGKWLQIWLAGGDLGELVTELRPAAEAYAKSLGCTLAIINGRPGWQAALPDYKRVAVALAKEL
jgi:hypothetical protein